jgi:CheY-like chemotaxis protein/MinD-like ATPase involved in chromosome partitioning or flagellar assembly
MVLDIKRKVSMPEKILIVDDDPDTVEFLRLILTRQGYQTLSALNGMQALNQAHSQQPDLIILDVMMPGLDGYEVARSLRRHPETALIPILMFTAKTQVEDKVAGYEAGVDIYLTKPIHPVELQANIKALLDQRKARAKTLSEKGYIAGVMAAKGGLGVSTVALNLDLYYQKKTNKKVIAAELRPGQGSWAAELNIPQVNGLSNLLQLNQPEITPASVEPQLQNTSYGVWLLLASMQSHDAQLATSVAQYEAIIQSLAILANFVVLDIGTSFLPAYESISELCDELILVTEPLTTAVKRTRFLIDELKSRSFGSAKPLTMLTVNHSHAEMTLSVSQIEKMLGQTIALGIPPATELAYLSAERSIPLGLIQPEGIIAQQFATLAEQIAKRASK